MDLGPITMSNTIVLPGNSQKTPLVDSTTWNAGGPWAPTTTLPAPDKSRGQLAGVRVTGTITPVTQGVTLTFELLTNPSGTTSAAFEADVNVSGTGGTGSVSIAAGATQPFDWLPLTPDWRVYVTAGGTAPSALRSTCNIVWDRAAT
jgi:hypothetical protein